MAEREESVFMGVQQLVSSVKAFLAAESDWEVRQTMLLNE